MTRMATFNDKRVIDTLITNGGYYEGDPRVVRIVEYENAFGQMCWGVVYITEPVSTWLRYDWPTNYIRNPQVIWTAHKEGNGSET